MILEKETVDAEAVSKNFPFIALYLFILIIFIVLSRLSFEKSQKDEIQNFISSMRFYNVSKHAQNNVHLSSNAQNYHSNKQESTKIPAQEIYSISHLHQSRIYNLDDVFDKDGNIDQNFRTELKQIQSQSNSDYNQNTKIIFSFNSSDKDENYLKIAKFSEKILNEKLQNFSVKIDNEEPQNTLKILLSRQ